MEEEEEEAGAGEGTEAETPTPGSKTWRAPAIPHPFSLTKTLMMTSSVSLEIYRVQTWAIQELATRLHEFFARGGFRWQRSMLHRN